MKTEVTFEVNRTKISKIFLIGAVILSLLYFISVIFRHFTSPFLFRGVFIRLFHLGQENNIPIWFAIFILTVSSILLGMIYWVKKQEGDLYQRYWLMLAIIFLALSIDEAASIHEEFGSILANRFPTSGYLYYIWVVPALIFVFLFCLVFSRFILHLPRRTAILFVISGVVYVGGAVGFEILAAPCEDQCDTFGFSILILFEETLEMLGIVAFIYALLDYVASLKFSLRLDFIE